MCPSHDYAKGFSNFLELMVCFVQERKLKKKKRIVMEKRSRKLNNFLDCLEGEKMKGRKDEYFLLV